MKIHKTVGDYAIKHNIKIRRDWNGFYYILDSMGEVLYASYDITAKSGLNMIKRFKKYGKV